MFRGVGKLKVRTLEGGGTSKTYNSVQRGRGPKTDEIECTYFLNAPIGMLSF